MANFVSYSNAEAIVTAIGLKFSALGGAYVAKGSIAFENLPSERTSSMVGYTYNVTNDFTTTSDFIEGAGKKYSAGTNVVIVDASDGGVTSFKFDVLGNFIDIDEIENEINAVAGMITGFFDETESYDEGDVVIYENALYSFNKAHAAGAWDSSDVDEVTVVELIASAEPEALTTQQVNALIALL